MRDWQFAAVLSLSVLGILIMALHFYDIPIVQFSHSTGKCVQVLGGDGAYGCDRHRLPEKYHWEWVK